MSELVQGDIVQWLKGRLWLVENGYLPRYHAVIADPPYALISISKRFGKADSAPAKFGNDGAFARASKGFMGQSWDGWDTLQDYQAWVTEWAALLLNVVYPGAVLAMFGGTRTWHRLTCGLEDAGWEIFDTLMYCYGSGFPKSHAVTNDFRNQRHGGNFKAISNDAMLRLSLLERAALLKLERGFDGFGSALKPSYEPILLCRAPRQGNTYAKLATDYGTAALNIDGSRIGTDERTYQSTAIVGAGRERALNVVDRGDGKTLDGRDLQKVLARQQRYVDERFETTVSGRWPANLIFDAEAAKLLDEMSGELQNGGDNANSPTREGMFGTRNTMIGGTKYAGDSGGASRFFYTAKADSAERQYPDGDEWKRLTHPTVKPLDLTRWLATLLLPPSIVGERRLLVPFAGVGSEMIGAHLAGWESVTGIEQDASYVEQGRKRLAWWREQKSYESGIERIKSIVRGNADDVELVQSGQLPLFAAVAGAN